MSTFQKGDRVIADFRGEKVEGVVAYVTNIRGIESVYIADPVTGDLIFNGGESWGIPLEKLPPPPPIPHRYFPSAPHTRRR